MSTQQIIESWESGVEPYRSAYVEESWDSANYANPLFIVHYPDGRTLSTMQESVANKIAKEHNQK